MIQRNPILACVIKQYGTGLYRTCVSFDKGHTVFLSAHPDEESATETINRFQEACRDGTIKTAEDVTGFATPSILKATPFTGRLRLRAS